MAGSISEAQAKIGTLQQEIAELKEKIAACDRVIEAMEIDRETIMKEQANDESATASANSLKDSLAVGQDAFAKGAFNVDPTGITSNDFRRLGDISDDINSSFQKMTSTTSDILNQINRNIENAIKSKEKYMARIEACNSEIDSLRHWIEEELRRQEEEKEEEQAQQGYINPNY